MKKRILGMLLAIVMVVGLIPNFTLTASAAENFYIVAGSPELFGAAWDPAFEENKLSLADDGNYYKTYNNVAAGTYLFKITTNGAWDNGEYNLEGDATFGGEEASVTVSQDGSTVIIGFDGTKALLEIIPPGGSVGGEDPNPGTDSDEDSELSVFHGTRTDFRDESVYTLLISRFYDGDSGNNVHCWDDGMAGNPDSDPAWRGDFKGLIEKLDYIKALGFTAVRLNPVVQNASGYDYHGFHPINLMDIDFRLESDGYTYEDLIDACHARGLKVIQYVDLNNTSNFGEEYLRKLFDLDEEANWSSITESLIPTETLLEQYPNYAELNPGAQYQARLDMLKNSLNSDGYYHTETSSAWSDSYVMQQGQIAGDCVDLNTEHPEVALYLAESCAWYAKMGVDAVSFNVARHINRWTFNEGILPLLNGLLEDAGLELDIFYDVEARSRNVWYNNNPSLSVPFYSWAETEAEWQNKWSDEDPNANIQTSIDHYNAHDTLEEYDALTSNNALLDGITYHTPDYSQSSGMHAFDFTMMWNFENAGSAFQAGVAEDRYINDSTWNLLSVDSWDYGPDGMEKTRYSNGVGAWKQNLNLMFTFRGIPSIYYGSEIEFAKNLPIDVGPNAPLANTGRAYYGDHLEGTVTAADFGEYEASGTVADTLNSELSQHIRMLNELRQKIPALRKGQYTTDGNYVSGNMAFIRRYTDADIDSLALVTLSGGAVFKNIPNGKYVDAVSGNEITVTNGTLTVQSPGSAGLAVYVCCADGFTGLDAELSPAESVLRFNVDGDTIAVSAITTVNGEAELPAAPALPDGYDFLGWIVNGEEYEPGDTVAISVDSMARANLKKPVAANIASVAVGGDTTEYSILSEAFEAAANASAEDEVILTLLDNITTTGETIIYSGSFTIDLNGKTWTFAGDGLHIGGNADIRIIDSSASDTTEGTGMLFGINEAFSAIYIYDSAKLEIQSGTVAGTCDILVNMVVFGQSTAELTVSGGTVKTTGSTAIFTKGSMVKVTGGTIEGSDEDIVYASGVIDLSAHEDPAGITIDNSTGTTVTVSDATIKLPEGYVMLDGSGNEASVLENGHFYTVAKAPVTHSVSVSAIDAADNVELADANLQILDADGSVVEEWDSTTAAREITGLESGTYTLRAVIAPDGYSVPTDTTFTLDADGNVTDYSGTVNTDGVLLFSFAKTRVKIAAVDQTSDKVLAGAHLQILDAEGNIVVLNANNVEWTSNGTAHEITGLNTGMAYTIRTTVAPNGYEIPADTQFSIDENGTVTYTDTVSEDGVLLVEFKETTVRILTVDAYGEALAGATIQIIDAQNKVVDEWTSIEDDEATEDIDESIYTVTGLKTGEEYALKATIAPVGYTISADTTFTMDAKGSVTYSGSVTENGVLLVNFVEASYDVTITQPSGGTVTTDNPNPIEGDKVTITVTPDEGKEVDRIIVKDETGNEIPVTESSDGTYSYEQPTGDVTVEVTMKETEFENEIIQPEGGDVEIDNLNPTMGDKVTITVTPDPGMEVTQVIVTDNGGNEIPVAKSSDGTYSYEQPAGDVTIKVTLKAKTYTVTLITNKGTIRDGDVTEYTYGVGAKLPTDVTRNRYSFGGWYDNEDCKGTPVTEITTTDIGDKTYYAQWNYIYLPPFIQTYPPAVSSGDNGDVNVTPRNPERGNTVTVAPTPDAGYEVDEVIVTDKSGNSVTVIDNGDGTYSFKQPSGEVTITVTFAEVEESCSGDQTCPIYGYTDLDLSAWYHDGIHFCVENDLMNGVGDDQFDPDGTATRSMIVTILWRLAGSPVVNYAMNFEDVPQDQWYSEAVRWAAAEGIVNGYGGGKFGTNDPISREQLATILYRYEQYRGGGFTGAWMIRMDYADLAEVSDWAYEAMCWMSMNGIVNGKPGKVLDPKGTATRAEAAAMLQRYCEVSGNET